MGSIAKSLPPLLAAISIVAPQSAAANDDPTLIVLEPSSPWNLDMGEHKCRIARLLGEGESQTIFLIDQWDPSTTAQWTLAGPAVEKYRNGRVTEYEFGNGGDAGEFELLGSSFGEFGNAVQSSSGFVTGDPLGDDEDQERDYLANPLGLPALDAKGAVGIEWLTVSQRGRTPVRLRLGSLEGPLAALNVCMENLVEFWGFDLEEQRRIASPPEVSNMPQVTREVAERYPKSALRRGAQADFHIRMTIDTQGQIENCVLLSQTVADKFELDGHPCTSFERYARIEPARDKTGQPIRTYLTNRIVYRIP